MIRRIIGKELEHHISKSRSCTFGNTCVVRAKNGYVCFNFSDIRGITGCELIVRNVFGNGQVSIITDKITIDTQILLKSAQKINIDFNNIIEVKRDGLSNGNIEIIGIDLYLDEEESKMSIDWKDTLKRCISYKNVRINGGRLYASEGAVIEASKIHEVSTMPPNMFKTEDGTVKFLGPCEIIALSVDGERSNPQPFIHLGDIQAIIPQILTAPGLPQPPTIQATQNESEASNIVFSANAATLFNSQYTKNAGYTGSSIVLGLNGEITIPIPAIKQNSGYSIVIECNKTSPSGNGKFSAYIAPHVTEQVYFSSQIRKTVIVPASTGTINEFDTYRLVINRPDSATGDVEITKVILISEFINRFSVETPVKHSPYTSLPDRRFVIVIPSYNNEAWVEKNIMSAIDQKYDNFRVIFVDDCSSDNTFNIAKRVVDEKDVNKRVTLIRNETRVGALENLYNSIHSCDDEEIILTLDGDDWLANEFVLNYLNNVYKNKDVWLTYGQYQNFPDGGIGISQQIPNNVIGSNGFRSHIWSSSHLRTFYAGLFKKINRDDLIYNGKFFAMTWDFAIMLPMLEMAGFHSKFISEILYVYNMQNPINDHKVDRNLQMSLDGFIRRKARYNAVNELSFIKMPSIKVGLIVIATGKYHKFIQPLISSADTHFMNEPNFNVTYFVMSDAPQDITTKRNAVQLNIPHKPFPFATMNRFRYFTDNKDAFKDMDFLFYVDVDCLFVNTVGTEILHDLTGVRHCGFYNGGGPFEPNEQSVFYTDPSRYRYYFGGGFSGGKRDNYLQLAEWCANKIDEDVNNGIIPIWHDETAINRYFLDNPPYALSPSYHYPENDSYYRRFWNGENFVRRILLLDKNHQEVRS